MARSPKTLIALLGTAALSSAVLGACGGGDDDQTSASDYVGAVCSAFTDLQSRTTEAQATLQEATATETDPEAAREDLSQYVSEAVSASEEVATRVEDAGVPDVENGEEIASTINDTLDQLTEGLRGFEDDVEALPTDSPQAFASGAQELTADFQAEFAGLGEGISAVGESDELDSAADENPECESLVGGTAGATGATGPQG